MKILPTKDNSTKIKVLTIIDCVFRKREPLVEWAEDRKWRQNKPLIKNPPTPSHNITLTSRPLPMSDDKGDEREEVKSSSIQIWSSLWTRKTQRSAPCLETMLCSHMSQSHGCQMAIARFLDCMCLALRASGLLLCYATLQNLIPSLPWVAPPRPPPWHYPRKGSDQILQRSIAEP